MRLRRPKRRHDPAPAAHAEEPLEVTVGAASFGTVVAIAGELDIGTAPRLQRAFTSSAVIESDAVLVDLSNVTFIDSTGLSLLLTLDQELRGRGGRLAIASPAGAARLLFDVTGIDEHLQLYASRDAAEAALLRPA
jgi:anti-sigma B factor antagonist